MALPGRSVSALLVALVVLALQLPALSGELIWDDSALLRATDLYTSTARFEEALTSPLGKETFYWRPLATTSFLIETAIHGGAVWGYRLTSALLHAGAAALAFLLLSRLLRSTAAGLLAALVWALHPVQVEAVTWVSGRFDQLAGFFCLATLVAVPREPEGRFGVRHVAVGLFTALALLSKEYALLIPAFVLCWSLVLTGMRAEEPTGGIRTWPWRPAAASFAGVVAVLLVRYDVIGYLLKARPFDLSVTERVLLVGRAMFSYATVLVFPFETVGPAHHGVRPIPVGDFAAWAGLVLTAGLLVLVVVAVFRSRRGWLVAAVLLALLPVSQILPLDLSGGLHAADRFLYVPSFFAVAALALVLHRRFAQRPERLRLLGRASIVLLAVFAVYRTVVVLPRWSTEVRYWERARSMAPRSDAVLANLFKIYWRAGRTKDAAVVADQLVGWYPRGGYFELRALVRNFEGDPAGALRELDKDVEHDPLDAETRVLRGEQLLRMGRAEDALPDFERALRDEAQSEKPAYLPVRPRALAGAAAADALLQGDLTQAERRLVEARASVEDADQFTWLAITWAALALGDDEMALESLERLERVDPAEWRLLIQLSAATLRDGRASDRIRARALEAGLAEDVVLGARAGGFARTGSYEAAAATYGEALAANPDEWDWAFFLLQLVRDGHAPGDAVEIAGHLVRIRPESAEAHDHLGYVLFEAGKQAQSETALRKAVELDPVHAEARYHLGMLLLRTERRDEALKEFAEARKSAAAAGNERVVELIERALR